MLKTKQPVRIQYNTKDQYKRDAKMLGLMDDFKVYYLSINNSRTILIQKIIIEWCAKNRISRYRIILLQQSENISST